METNDTPKPAAPKQQIKMTLDYRIISAVLLLVVIGMFGVWRPWEDARAKDRTVEVTGTAKVTAAPDEFVFSPSYQTKNADKQAALTELTKKSDEVVKKLKDLGVPDNKIATHTSGYDIPTFAPDNGGSKATPTYTLSMTVTVGNKDLAQKVQDYLVTTSPTGAVSPQPQFADATRQALESKARDEATKDARKKAEQSARNLGFSVGDVKQVNDGAGFGGIASPARGMQTMEMNAADTSKLSIQPGENDLNYSVTVVYYVK